MLNGTSKGLVQHISGAASDRGDMPHQWLDFIGRHMFKYRLGEEKLERSFAVEACGRSTNKWSVSRVTTQSGKSRLTRSARDINSDPHDRYMVYVSLRDEIEFEQFGRVRKGPSSSLTLVSGTDALCHSKLGDNDTLCLGVPRKFVDRRVPSPEKLCAMPISVSDGLGGLVRHSIGALQQESLKMSDEEFVSSSQLLADLVILALSSGAGLTTSVSFVRSQNLARAKRIIRARLGEPDLKPAHIAEACGISLSYLHNLFRDDGRSACEYLLETRLNKARQLLRSRSGNVTDVALTCGFSNLSSFSTSFRKAYGLAPREILRR